MIKSKLYDFLRNNLGEYLYGLAEDQLDVAILSGHVSFKNANFKPSKVNELLISLGFPLHLKAGMIGNLSVKYNLLKWSSNPVTVVLDDLYLLFGPILVQSNENSNELDPFDYSDSSDEELSFDRPDPSSASDSEGLDDNSYDIPPPPAETKKGILERYFAKIAMNLTLTVNNVHIRYEDETYPFQHPFSFGICLDSLYLNSTKNAWNFKEVYSSEVFHTAPRNTMAVKEGRVENFFIYVNSMSDMAIPTSLYEATLSSPIGIFEAIAAYELRELMVDQKEILRQNPKFCILEPTSVQWNLIFGKTSPKIKVSLILPDIKMRVSTSMSECIKNFFTYFTNAQLWGIAQRYRPLYRITSIPREEQESVEVSMKRRKVIRKWFIYALRFFRIKKKLFQFIRQRRRDIKRAQNRQNGNFQPRRNLVNDLSSSSNSDNDNSLNSMSNIMRTSNELKKFSFADLSKPRQRMVPGVKQDNNLQLIVKQYNKQLKLNESRNTPIKTPVSTSPKPLSPVKPVRQPKWFEPLEVEIRGGSLEFILEDEEEDIHLHFTTGRFGLDASLAPEEIQSRGTITTACVSLVDSKQKVDMMNLGEDIVQEVLNGKGKSLLTSIFSKRSPEKPKVTPQHAITYSFHYLPESSRGTEIDFLNALEVDFSAATMQLSYSHKLLVSLLDLYEAYQIDSVRKQNQKIEVQKAVNRRKTETADQEQNVLGMRYKNKEKTGGDTFYWAGRIMAIKAKLNLAIKKLDQLLIPLNYNIGASFGGFNVKMLQEGKAGPLLDLGFPASKLEALKQENHTKMSFNGFELQQYDTIESSVNYMKRQFETVMKKLEFFKEFMKNQKSI